MTKLPFREFLKTSGPIAADGAMATSLYEKGFYINRSFEELCVTDAQAVREVTKAFKRAGSQIFHTNTFNASQPKLAQHGLQNDLQKIILAASEIAKQEAQTDGYVVGVIGPLGVLVEPLGPTSVQEAEDFFADSRSHARARICGCI